MSECGAAFLAKNMVFSRDATSLPKIQDFALHSITLIKYKVHLTGGASDAAFIGLLNFLQYNTIEIK